MRRNAFFKKWNGRVLEDWCTSVSKEFNSFQNAFKREMNNIAEEIGATLVSYSKGYYDMSGFFERNGHYVYFHYCNYCCGGRNVVNLTDNSVMCARTAKNAKDYRGGCNNDVSFDTLKETVDHLLNQEHRQL